MQDDVTQAFATTIQNLKNIKELNDAVNTAKLANNDITRTKAASELIAILARLGFLGAGTPAVAANDSQDDSNSDNTDNEDDYGIPSNEDKAVTNARKKSRQTKNNDAIKLLDEIESKGLKQSDLTIEQLEVLKGYTGSGGGLKAKSGLRGSAYEYYTPKEVAAVMWDLAAEWGFKGGKVLDPSAGTGVMAANSPENAVMENIELDAVSGTISGLLNNSDRSNTIISPFEQRAKDTDDNIYDMVMTNVPFGDNATRGANKSIETKYQKEPLENYFILRSLEKLKHGGIAVFITPTPVVSGAKAADKKRLRNLTSLKAEFLGAYRLPTEVFLQTGANVVTDIVIYRKYSQDATSKIKELYDAGDIETLTAANVLWQPYLSGHYFKQKDHKKFILGDTVEVKNKYGKMVESTVSTKKTPEILKMMQRFGDSRIDYSLLDATDAAPIEYQNGDTIFQDGNQLKYDNGSWQVMAKEVTDTDREIQEWLAVMGSALDMVEANLTYPQIDAVEKYCQQTGQQDLIPRLAKDIYMQCQNIAPANRNAAWACNLCAQAIEDVIAQHGYGFNFVEGEPKLTAYMKTAFLDGKNSSLKHRSKENLGRVGLHYAKGKYSSAWRGEINTESQNKGGADSYTNVIGRMQYENKSLSISREQLAIVNPDADPLNDDEWFVNHNGTEIIAANDFLVGNLSDRLADIDKQIARAINDDIKAKLTKQKAIARDSVARLDFKTLELDLRTPLISADVKVQFLKESVHAQAFVSYVGNRPTPDIDVKGGSTKDSDEKKDTDKLYNRIGDWLANGTITLGGVTLISMSQRDALNWVTKEINEANIKFGAWIKANKAVMDELESSMNSDKNLYFTQNSDETPIEIAGMNPALSLHGYQNAYVRQQGRFFGGINGMGVGLGKTFSALSSVQHVQNIGVKKKTIFVVPNTVLSNWRKEAMFAYQDMSDTLFIGLREKDDKFRVYSNKYDEDLLAAIDGKYTKIFMTYEAFKRIRLKDDTVYDYAQYIKKTDMAFSERETHKDNEKTDGLTKSLIDRIKMKSNAPYLEDMGIDSVVIDEAHAFKNSITAPETDDRIKYLSQPNQSARGEDAQAKLWYIRGLTANQDGVQLLTATPITNSPLEIYSMLSLASGRDTVNRMCGGIWGADDFIKVMCDITEEVMPTIDGGERSQNVFTGIKNANILRTLVQSQAVIKDAKDVGMSVVIPDREEVSTAVDLGKDTMAELKKFQDAYTVAKEMIKENSNHEYLHPDHPLSPSNPFSPINEIMGKYGEDAELIAHPFNLIRKMDIIIADSEFSEMATFYDFDDEQEALAESVIAQFNSADHTDKRSRLSPFTDEKNDSIANYKKDGESKIFLNYEVTIRAKIILHSDRKRIVIDTLNGKTQSRFEALADKAKLNLDVTVSAKVAAMLANFKAEQASPRGANDDGTGSNIVKQIIFCDHLFLHNKIKKILSKRAGVPANKIAIITGQVNNEPDEMIDIQDGFNAGGDDNQYQVIIANKKAEVGINLQRGTQAIHHLTTGWTPDSLEQRNGRGARQGNKTKAVAIYYYDADGTFDEFKRTMINKKDEWISSVLDSEGKNTIAVSGSISRTEQDALITIGSDKEAMREYMIAKDEKEADARRAAAINKQRINMDVVAEQTEKLKNLSPKNFYDAAVLDVINMTRNNLTLFNKNKAPKTSAATREKGEALYNKQRQIVIDKLQDIIDSVSFQLFDKNWAKDDYSPVDEVPKKPTRSATLIYNMIKDNAKEFAPAKHLGWVELFTRNYLDGERATKGAYQKLDLIVDDGSMYQAQFDEAKDSAGRLINQSVIAANNIANDMGVEGIALPSNAGELLADKSALIVNGIYMQAGSFIHESTASQERIALVYKGSSGILETLRVNKKANATAYEAPFTISTGNPDEKWIGARHVINETDSRYLDIVKMVAAVEDDMLRLDFLKPDTVTYSTYLPMIAEYRDKAAKAEWDLSFDFSGNQYGLDGGVTSAILPYTVLSVETPFSVAAVAMYKKSGVDIDLKTGKFSVTNDKIAVTANKYRSTSLNSDYNAAVVEFIKQCGVKITGKDDILNHASILVGLAKEDKAAFSKAIQDYIATITHETNADSFDDALLKLYDNCVYNPKYMDAMPTDEIKRNVMRLAHPDNKPVALGGRIGGIDLIKQFNEVVQAEISSKVSDTLASSGLNLDDLVVIGGYTKSWYKLIKEYGENYGIAIHKGKNYFYDPQSKLWTISYGAYNALVKAYPKAEHDLSFEKKI